MIGRSWRSAAKTFAISSDFGPRKLRRVARVLQRQWRMSAEVDSTLLSPPPIEEAEGPVAVVGDADAEARNGPVEVLDSLAGALRYFQVLQHLRRESDGRHVDLPPAG